MKDVGIAEMTEEEKKEMVTEDTIGRGQMIILRQTAGMTGENVVAVRTYRETKNARRGIAEARKGVQVLNTQSTDVLHPHMNSQRHLHREDRKACTKAGVKDLHTNLTEAVEVLIG